MKLPSRKMDPRLLKVYSLWSMLSIEHQVKFMDLLISTRGEAQKMELIEQALQGRQVWDDHAA